MNSRSSKFDLGMHIVVYYHLYFIIIVTMTYMKNFRLLSFSLLGQKGVIEVRIYAYMCLCIMYKLSNNSSKLCADNNGFALQIRMPKLGAFKVDKMINLVMIYNSGDTTFFRV